MTTNAQPTMDDERLGDEARYSLITRRLELQNGWSGQKLQSLVAEGKAVKYLWAHIGYLIPLIKFADFIRAGGEVTVEFVDTYAFLINYRFPWDQVRHRTKYYRCLITAALEAVGVPLSRVTMVEASSYQSTSEFMTDFWKLCALCSQQDVRDTGAEVGASTMLSPLLTPLLQELAVEHLGVDVELGGTDQRGIFNLGEQFLPGLGYEKRAHVMNGMLPSLTGGKMSSSHAAHTKIMFLDDAAAVEAKVAGASCPAGSVEGNGVLPVVEHILMPIGELRMLQRREEEGKRKKKGAAGGADGGRRAGEEEEEEEEQEGGSGSPFAARGAPAGTLLSVGAAEAEGGFRHYCTYGALQRDYVAGAVGPAALREAVAAGVNEVLRPVREAYGRDGAWRGADRMGYPEDHRGES